MRLAYIKTQSDTLILYTQNSAQTLIATKQTLHHITLWPSFAARYTRDNHVCHSLANVPSRSYLHAERPPIIGRKSVHHHRSCVGGWVRAREDPICCRRERVRWGEVDIAMF